MAKASPKKGSAVAKAAERLRRLAIKKKDGEFIGSEEDLIAKLQVSRPTLRQASAQVIQENLIAVRRGVGGGYFACKPDSMTVSRIAAIYLQSRGLKLPQILRAIKPLRLEIAGLAAQNAGNSDTSPLRAFIEAEEAEMAKGKQTSYRDFLGTQREFGRVVADLAGNDVLNLFLQIVYDLTQFTSRDEDVWFEHPNRVEVYRQQRLQMARAILEGDDEIARVASGRCSKLVADWMKDDAAKK